MGPENGHLHRRQKKLVEADEEIRRYRRNPMPAKVTHKHMGSPPDPDRDSKPG
jgi:hypothetical protein